MIFVVEDDHGVRELELYALRQSGYEAEGYETPTAFRQALEKTVPDCVLLDVMLPGEDGLSLLRFLRRDARTRRVPVILVTARDAEMDKVNGLDCGADDYLTKPFGVMELLARVRSQLRRYLQLGGGQARPSQTSIGAIALDDDAKAVTLDGEPVSLTPREYDILKLLIQNAGTVFSPKEIYRRVWGGEPYGAENAVAVHIRHLREKLEINPADPHYLKVVWGQGYKMERDLR